MRGSGSERLFTRDAYLLIAARSLRLFGYGFLSVLFALYLAAIGLSAAKIGVLFQAYTMALVAPEERAAAAGLTSAVRPAAASLAPMISGLALQSAAMGLPFILAGGLKAAYDLALWATFRKVRLRQPAAPGP